MRLQRDSVEGDRHYEQRSDPPGVAHAGIFDREAGVCLRSNASIDREVVFAAVFVLCPLVIVIHQVANGVGAGNTSKA